MKRLFGSDKKAEPHEGEAGAEKGDAEGAELIRGLSNLYSPKSTGDSHVRDIADVLLEMGKISAQQLDKIHRDGQKGGGGNIEQLILNSGVASTDDILAAKAKLYGFEFRHLEASQLPLTNLIPTI